MKSHTGRTKNKQTRNIYFITVAIILHVQLILVIPSQ